MRTANLAIAFLAALLASPVVDACSRKGGPPSLEQNIADAEEIFVAHLVSATELKVETPDADDAPFETFVEGRYTVLETLKGDVAAQGVVHDFPFGPGNCSLGLLVGWDYVFFVDHDADDEVGGRKLRWVGLFTGSQPLGPYRDMLDEEEDELADLRRKVRDAASPKP